MGTVNFPMFKRNMDPVIADLSDMIEYSKIPNGMLRFKSISGEYYYALIKDVEAVVNV